MAASENPSQLPAANAINGSRPPVWHGYAWALAAAAAATLLAFPLTGHLDLATLPGLVDVLRSAGVVTTSTHVVATHLSHHNPSPEMLYLRLRDLGARAVPDGTPIAVGGPRATLSL